VPFLLIGASVYHPPFTKQKYFLTLNMDFARSSLGYYKGRVGNRISGKVKNTHRLLVDRLLKRVGGSRIKSGENWGIAHENTYNQIRKTIENNEKKLKNLKTNYAITLESIRSSKRMLQNLNRKRKSFFILSGNRARPVNQGTQTNKRLVNQGTQTNNRRGNQGTQTNNRNGNQGTRTNNHTVQYNGKLSNNERRAGLINQLKNVHNVNELQKLSLPQLIQTRQNLKRAEIRQMHRLRNRNTI